MRGPGPSAFSARLASEQRRAEPIPWRLGDVASSSGKASPMGPGSPPFDSLSAVERGAQSQGSCPRALWSPCPTPPLGLWSPFSCSPLPESPGPREVPGLFPATRCPAPGSGPACPGSPEHTARKSRWSLLYCHRLARRLEAAREDFSLSGLGWGGKGRGQQEDRLGREGGCRRGLTCPASS